jgi:hypothetical protein
MLLGDQVVPSRLSELILGSSCHEPKVGSKYKKVGTDRQTDSFSELLFRCSYVTPQDPNTSQMF